MKRSKYTDKLSLTAIILIGILVIGLSACSKGTDSSEAAESPADQESPAVSNPPVDIDNDGIPDEDDNCPEDSNFDQEDADGDGLGDACDEILNISEDEDGDTIPDDIDNCPDVYNTDQEDTDEDGQGDACDEDSIDPSDEAVDKDNDTIENDIDNCPDIANTDQKDSDHDGLGDACDLIWNIRKIDPKISEEIRSSGFFRHFMSGWTKVVDGDIQSMATDESGTPLALGLNGTYGNASIIIRTSENAWAPTNIDISAAVANFSYLSDPQRALFEGFETFPIKAIAKTQNRLYAGTSGLLLFSDDEGQSWNVGDTLRIFAKATGEEGTHDTCAGESQRGLTAAEAGDLIGVKRICDIVLMGSTAVLGFDNGTVFNKTLASHIDDPTNDNFAWRGLDSALYGHIVNDLAVKGSVIIAGTNAGALKSADGGASWTKLGLEGEEVFAVSGVGEGAIYAGTANALYRSSNGTTLEKVQETSGVMAIESCGNAIVVGTTTGVLFSEDQGVTWSDISGSLKSKMVKVISCDGDAIYAGTGEGLYEIPM